MSAAQTTIFTRMTALAEQTGAINLGQGFPDENGPTAVIDAAVAAMRAGSANPTPRSCVRDFRTRPASPRSLLAASAPIRARERRRWCASRSASATMSSTRRSSAWVAGPRPVNAVQPY
jgi:hypothetical protein